MNNENVNYFYAGRVYQYYLDNQKDLISGKVRDLGFLIPKTKGLEISKLKQMLQGLVEKDGVWVKCSILRNGWKFKLGLVS